MPVDPITDPNQPLITLVENFIGQQINQVKQMRQRAVQNMRFVWNNPQGYTPAQILGQFGTRAASLVSDQTNYVTLVASKDPTVVADVAAMMAGNTLTINQDGTVTVVPPAPTPPTPPAS